MHEDQPGKGARGRVGAHEIVVAAFELFAEKGYRATTVEEIAAKAGVSPRTIFRHFRTKADIAVARGRERLEVLSEKVRSWPRDQNISQAIVGVAVEHAAYLEAHGFGTLITEMASHPAVTRRRTELLRIEYPDLLTQDFAARAGRAAPSFEDRLAARLVMLLIDEAGNERMEKGDRPWDQKVTAVIDALRDLLGPSAPNL